MLLSCREHMWMRIPLLPSNVTTRGPQFSRISCWPFCYWNLMIRRSRGACYINICAVNPFADPLAFSRHPLVLTAALLFSHLPHPFVLLRGLVHGSLGHSATLWSASGPVLPISRRWFSRPFIRMSANFLLFSCRVSDLESSFFLYRIIWKILIILN